MTETPRPPAGADRPAVAPSVLRPRVPTRRFSDARIAALGIAGVCLLTAIYLSANYTATKRLEDAARLMSQGRYADAVEEAERVGRAPASDAAEFVRAFSLAALGDNAAARRAYLFAVREDPENYLLHRDLAVVQLRLGERAEARAELARARALNPRMPIPQELLPILRR